MPHNLQKEYNKLLEINSYNEFQREKSLLGVFNKHIAYNQNFKFRLKHIKPTPADGKDSMERLFTHLTTIVANPKTRKREFDMDRSVRLHWIRHHIEERKKEKMLIFTVKEPNGVRTYIYDTVERYVIVLEPMRDLGKKEYALLTAYYENGKDRERSKMFKKYDRRLVEVL